MLILVPGQGHSAVDGVGAGTPAFLVLGPVATTQILDVLSLSVVLDGAGGFQLSAGITGSREGTAESLSNARQVFLGNTAGTGPFNLLESGLLAFVWETFHFPLGVRVQSGPLFVVVRAMGATDGLIIKASLSVKCLVSDVDPVAPNGGAAVVTPL